MDPLVIYDQANIIARIMLARSLSIHPDTNDYIALLYIQIIRAGYVDNRVRFWLMMINNNNLYIRTYDPKIFIRFKFYDLLVTLSIHKVDCKERKISFDIRNECQIFTIRLICCSCNYDIRRKHFNNEFTISYIQIYQILSIACENNLRMVM